MEHSGDVHTIVHKVASIAYEGFCQGIYTIDTRVHAITAHTHDINTKSYRVLDVRNQSAYDNNPIHKHAIHIPLESLRDRIYELSTDHILIPYCG